VVGFLAEGLVRWLLTGLGDRRGHPRNHDTEAAGGHAVRRVIVDLLGLVVFVSAAFAVFLSLYQGHEASRELIVGALLATAEARLAMIIARHLLAPGRPDQRALPFDDASAATLYRGIVGLAILYVALDVALPFFERWQMPRESFLAVAILCRLLFVVIFPCGGSRGPSPR
jgi:hypothetical protein